MRHNRRRDRGRRTDRTRGRTAVLHLLADRRPGMSRDGVAALAQALAPAQHAPTARRCFDQRGGQGRRAPGRQDGAAVGRLPSWPNPTSAVFRAAVLTPERLSALSL